MFYDQFLTLNKESYVSQFLSYCLFVVSLKQQLFDLRLCITDIIQQRTCMREVSAIVRRELVMTSVLTSAANSHADELSMSRLSCRCCSWPRHVVTSLSLPRSRPRRVSGDGQQMRRPIASQSIHSLHSSPLCSHLPHLRTLDNSRWFSFPASSLLKCSAVSARSGIGSNNQFNVPPVNIICTSKMSPSVGIITLYVHCGSKTSMNSVKIN